jgi:hypothetical protein
MEPENREPPKFRTMDGHEYQVAITTGAVRRVADEYEGVRLTSAYLDPDLRAKFFGDDLEFAGLLYHILRPQVEARGLSRAQFEETIDADAIRAAGAAVLEEMAFFFEDPMRSLILRHVAEVRRLGLQLLTNVADAAKSELEKVLATTETSLPSLSTSVSNTPASAA